jgi:cephalosporin hydroxylase
MNRQEIINNFHQLFYYSGVWVTNTTWMGISTQKCPLDLWIYQEIIQEIKPDLIIETGTCFGGSALFLAQMCDLIGRGRVVTIDIACRDGLPENGRILYLNGSSIEPAILCSVSGLIRDAKTVMVVLDSDHSKDYVLKEMGYYANFVTPGSFMIVEDSDVNGHPICPDHGPGPAEAIIEFLKTHPEFEVDVSREKFMLTQNPGGYLRRK